MDARIKIISLVLAMASVLFALDLFALPEVTSELKSDAQKFYKGECQACHRWARKFAAPPMKENVSQYKANPEEMVKYLMAPSPKHPDQWPAMDITPLTETQAKMMTAWLLYILENPEDPGRPK